jgi:hypothetical protein
MSMTDENQTPHGTTATANDEQPSLARRGAEAGPAPASGETSRAPLYYILAFMLALVALLAYGFLTR